MRYIMSQKWFSLSSTFNIRDEHERDIYQVKGEFFSIPQRLSFQDMTGNELMQIKRRLLAWSPTYEIYRNGQIFATVSKDFFSWFGCRFTINASGSSNFEVSGEILDHEYTFFRGGTEVAHVSKHWFTWTDTYGIDVLSGEDDILFLACAVVIDMTCHANRD